MYVSLLHFGRIYEDKPGHTAIKCMYKHWSTDSDWLPKEDERQIEVFKLDENDKQILPVGEPDVIDPDYGMKQDFDKTKTNIR